MPDVAQPMTYNYVLPIVSDGCNCIPWFMMRSRVVCITCVLPSTMNHFRQTFTDPTAIRRLGKYVTCISSFAPMHGSCFDSPHYTVANLWTYADAPGALIIDSVHRGRVLLDENNNPVYPPEVTIVLFPVRDRVANPSYVSGPDQVGRALKERIGHIVQKIITYADLAGLVMSYVSCDVADWAIVEPMVRLMAEGTA